MDQSQDAYSIDEFCERHGFSRGSYYNLLKAKKAPKFFTIGARRFISREAAEQWRREREAVAETEFGTACEKRRSARQQAAKTGASKAKRIAEAQK